MNTFCYPKIDPVSEKIHRPFWSVMIPTCNRTKYLRTTIKSVLDQDPGTESMQIEVIDNFSSRELNVEEVVKDVGDDRVSYYRQPFQVDFQENWSTCIRRAYGKWVHILHDDDIVLPGFYQSYREFIEYHPDVKLVFSQAVHINENDEPISTFKPAIPDFPQNVIKYPFKLLLMDNFIYSTSSVVSRHEYEKLGGFHPVIMHTVDWDMWLRISLDGPIGYIKKPLLAYRIHSGSGSFNQNNTRELIDKKYNDICYIINSYKKNLPPNLQKKYSTYFMKKFAESANSQVKFLLEQKNYDLAFNHSIWSKKMYPSFINKGRFWWYYICYFRQSKLKQ
jgi:glycosyltransferase involved in cell wall biosynthesis